MPETPEFNPNRGDEEQHAKLRAMREGEASTVEPDGVSRTDVLRQFAAEGVVNVTPDMMRVKTEEMNADLATDKTGQDGEQQEAA